MKKLLLSFFVIVAFTFYALMASTRSGTGASIVATTPPSTTVTFVPSPTKTPIDSGDDDDDAVATMPTPVPIASKPPANVSGAYRDGTYIGPATDAYFGTVQVRAVVSGGALSDVQFLQYPNDRGTSLRISNQSMPRLRSEAIAAQSAKVDIISGATQTSEAFQKSLASALASASK